MGIELVEKQVYKKKEICLELMKWLLATVEDREVCSGDWESLYRWLTTCKKKTSTVSEDGARFWTSSCLSEKDKLMLAIRECLSTQNWYEALQALIIISGCPNYGTYNSLRLALELFYRLGSTRTQFDELTCVAKRNPDATIKEVYTDLFLYDLIARLPEGIQKTNGGLVVFNEITGLMNLSSSIRDNKLSQVQIPVELHAETMQNFYYPGFIAYVRWLILLLEMDSISASSQTNTLKALNEQAVIATTFFSECEKSDGVWDCIVVKHVEILETLAKLENSKKYLTEIKEVLKKYEIKHPTNINALKLTYHFYKRNSGYFKNEAIRVLKKIYEMKPNDELVLELVASDEQDRFARLELLFELLDHLAWKDNEKLWDFLANILVKGVTYTKGKKRFLESIKNCWEPRKIWWPQHHFSTWTSFVLAELETSKACVALILLGRESMFYKNVKYAGRRSTSPPKNFGILDKAKVIRKKFCHLEAD